MNTTTLNMTTLDGGVIIKKGGGGGVSASNVEYLDIRGIVSGEYTNSALMYLLAMGTACRCIINDTVFAGPASYFMVAPLEDPTAIQSIRVDWDDIVADRGRVTTVKGFFLELGITQEELDAIPRLTKEQFYSLD